jgi:hypothetical protein
VLRAVVVLVLVSLFAVGCTTAVPPASSESARAEAVAASSASPAPPLSVASAPAARSADEAAVESLFRDYLAALATIDDPATIKAWPLPAVVRLWPGAASSEKYAQGDVVRRYSSSEIKRLVVNGDLGDVQADLFVVRNEFSDNTAVAANKTMEFWLRCERDDTGTWHITDGSGGMWVPVGPGQ